MAPGNGSGVPIPSGSRALARGADRSNLPALLTAPTRPHKTRERFRRALRGPARWGQLLSVTALAAAVGGLAGYQLVKPEFRASGLVRVDPDLPAGSDAADGAALLETEAHVLRSEPIVHEAMRTDAWRSAEDGRSKTSPAEFQRRLSVTTAGATGLMQVTFADRHPAAAAAGARAVIDTYLAGRGQRDQSELQAELAGLAQQRDDLQRQQAILEQRVRTIATEGGYAPDQIDRVYELKLAEAHRLERLVHDVRVLLAMAAQAPQTQPAEQAAPPAGGAPATQPTGLADLAVPELDLPAELTDRQPEPAAPWWAQREADKPVPLVDPDRAVEAARQKQREALERILRERERLIAQRIAAERSNAEHEVLQRLAAQRAAAERDAAQQVANLRLSEENLRKEHAAAVAAYEAVGRLNVQIKTLRAALAEGQKQLARLDEGIAALQARIKPAQRAELQAAPTEPLAPAVDRRPQAAGLGALAGGSLGFLTMLAVALSDRRWRRAADLKADLAGVPVLSSLPDLPTDGKARRELGAAESVHRVRALLQVAGKRNGSGEARSIGITAASVGAGKTSVAAALGVSYAQSGSRTLLIDLDLAGGGLRARLRAARELAEQAAPASLDAVRPTDASVPTENAPATPDLDRAMDEMLTGPSGPRHGAHGSANGTSPNRTALAANEDPATTGLLGYLNGLSLHRCTRETHVPGLDVLPSIGAGREQLAKLSPDAIRNLIEQAKLDYDVVLIDTGPTPDSVEGLMVAAAVDRVLVVVPRNESQDKLDETVDHLRATGAPLAGVVFNRAGAKDVKPSLTAREQAARKQRESAANRQASNEPYYGSGILAMELDNVADGATAKSVNPPPAAQPRGA